MDKRGTMYLSESIKLGQGHKKSYEAKPVTYRLRQKMAITDGTMKAYDRSSDGITFSALPKTHNN